MVGILMKTQKYYNKTQIKCKKKVFFNAGIFQNIPVNGYGPSNYLRQSLTLSYNPSLNIIVLLCIIPQEQIKYSRISLITYNGTTK